MAVKGDLMAYLAVLEVAGLTAEDYDSVIARMHVEHDPSPGIYLHLCAPMDGGMRIVELWDSEEGFREFVQERLSPAAAELGSRQEPAITISVLHNVFAPRLKEIPDTKPSREREVIE
jgi:hypothetical protein